MIKPLFYVKFGLKKKLSCVGLILQASSVYIEKKFDTPILEAIVTQAMRLEYLSQQNDQ